MKEDEDLLRIQQAHLTTFTSESGVIVLNHMKRECSQTSFVSGDSHATAFNEGRRSFYLDIITMMEQAVEERKPQTEGGDNANQ